MFKCRQKSKSKLSWLVGTEAFTLDKNMDIDFGWILLEIITYISGVTSIIRRGIYVGTEFLGTSDINSQLGFFF